MVIISLVFRNSLRKIIVLLSTIKVYNTLQKKYKKFLKMGIPPLIMNYFTKYSDYNLESHIYLENINSCAFLEQYLHSFLEQKYANLPNLLLSQ